MKITVFTPTYNRGYDENHTVNNLFSEEYLDLNLLHILYRYS